MAFFGDHVTASIGAFLSQHLHGLETTIYADAEALEILSSSVVGGLIGVLQDSKGKLRARNIKPLSEHTQETLTVDDGPHVLVMLSGVAWMGQDTWRAVRKAVSRPTVKRCTLCIAVPEQLWPESAKLISKDLSGLKLPATRESVYEELRDAAGKGAECSVETYGLVAMAALGGGFALPSGGVALRGTFAQKSEWVETERVALGLASVVQELGLDARFYSMGSGAARRVARRSAAMPHVSGGRIATVVVLDRAADLAAIARHGGHMLDQIARAAEATGASLNMLLTRLRESGIGDSLALQTDRRSAVHAVEKSKSVSQLWTEAEGVAERGNWQEIQAAEKTMALVLSCESDPEAAWDHVLEAIPKISGDMVSSLEGLDPSSSTQIQHALVVCTPAPLMLVMAASILAPRKLGFPSTQREMAKRRLVADYLQVSGRESEHAGAQQWASWFTERVALLAEGKEQFDFGMECEMGVPYTPVLPKIADEVLSGRRMCVDLELAEHGGASGTTAGSLLKGLGRRFLSHRASAMSPGSPDTPGDTFASTTTSPGSSGSGFSSQHNQRAEDVASAAMGSDVVVFFVVGGVTVDETASIAAAAQRHSSGSRQRRVMVGSTGGFVSIGDAFGRNH
ncbi:hypothetical protein GGI15_000662 [Coemansia interrupta]|uniref:Uncharacterized protein n=1 Tax=Coemansia interrupta TaxID=1126814 RepID=A0A9W8HSQ2_9FUNG|nr:hypothetical protein GGI15_000662 [Coemansia interrupta]